MKCFWIILILLISETYSIQTRAQRPVRFVDQETNPSRNFRHIDTSSVNIDIDWEHGLREATVQALLRERFGDHNLRKHIYSAPLLGKQNKATPFGDIAILARGQLYANYAGFIFVQDQYQNDCDDCHTIDEEALRGRCININCQIWHSRNNEQLVALWSIKRIRHRTVTDRYNQVEVEYTIAPVGLRYPKETYLTKEDTFNYNIPGHVFILRNTETHQNLASPQHDVNILKHGAFVAQTPDGRKFILHSFPGILAPDAFRYQDQKNYLTTSSTTAQYSEEDAKKVYQTLLELLHKKTSSIEPDRFVPSTPKTSTTLSGTTLVQFPDGQVVPITELETPYITKSTPSYVTVHQTPIRHEFKPTTTHLVPQTTAQIHVPTTKLTPQTFVPTTSQARIPTTKLTPQTFVPTTAQARVPPTKLSTPQYVYTTTNFIAPTTKAGNEQTIYAKPSFVGTIQRPQFAGTTQAATKPPVKMTFHFYAAEEQTTRAPTEPTSVFTREEFKGTTPTSPRPATIVRVTKPIRETTYSSRQSSTEASYETSTTKLYSDFTVPITVLEESSDGTTSQEKYSTTRDEGTSVTFSQTPTASLGEPTITQFYHPTATMFQEKESVGTTYAEVPRFPTIETTVGITRVMAATQNKTTEMVYYAAEEATESTAPTRLTVASTEPTNTILETESSTPKRIVTTIAADGKVSVKTTPFSFDQELFGSTKSTTYKATRPYKASTTASSVFLDDDVGAPLAFQVPSLFKKPSKDYSDDEIFGSTRSTTAKTSTATRPYTKSDVEEALFDNINNNSRRSKALKRTKMSTTEPTPPRVVYSEFFEATRMTTQAQTTTLPSVDITSTSATTAKTLVSKLKPVKSYTRLKQGETDNKIVPVTSQSYLTSISYEVNKRKKLRANKDNNTLENSGARTFDNDFAMRLVGQAKSVAYLDKVSTTTASTVASTSAKTTKKTKYTRKRTYVPRAKRPNRKRVDNKEETGS